jgi:alpha-1,6-mannosyltransferase
VRVVDISSFYAAGGGIRSYYLAKAAALPARGFDCHVVVPGRRAERVALGGATLHRIPGPPLGRGYHLFGALDRLVATIAGLAPDLIELGSHYLLPELIARLNGRAFGRAATLGFYHSDYPDTYVAPRLGRLGPAGALAGAGAWAWVRRAHRGYAATLVASHHIGDKLRARGVPRVRWVGLGVDPDRFAPGDDRREGFAYVGRLAAEKGFDDVLAAAPRLAVMSGRPVVVLGAGPLERAARRAEARGHLRLAGLGAPDAVADAMRGALAVIAPGRHETFSLAAAEAMACGTPVLGADRAGNGELLAAGGGVGFAAGSPDDLVRAAATLLCASPVARRELGRRGRRHILAHHTWGHVIDRLAAIYHEVA